MFVSAPWMRQDGRGCKVNCSRNSGLSAKPDDDSDAERESNRFNVDMRAEQQRRKKQGDECLHPLHLCDARNSADRQAGIPENETAEHARQGQEGWPLKRLNALL
ncbi:hypothetical protein HGO38_00620 [Rhizobium sp. CG5]|uniref:hypothetical protein n=1 Tax=Rhizobium sp. CG5 TaxID=2726076 RepID=UPI002033355B|nr:hypothetical protein [Rhizobium sp. CG5]MCM2471983.1 hypothetical protein [Rhizobium sp. CG5]